MRDLSLHMLDIIRNSISAGAGMITVSVSANKHEDRLVLRIKDDGMGMDESVRVKVTDPFYTSRATRKVGLGVPLLQASARQAGGDVAVASEKGRGTTVTAYFRISHIDRLPLGDIPETMSSLIASEPETRFVLVLAGGNRCFRLDTFELKDKLGEVPVTDYEVVKWIREFIDEGIKTIFGGVLHEVVS